MMHHDERSMSERPVSEGAFLRRLAELENAVELSTALADQAELLERRFVGTRADGENPQGGPAHVPTSLNDALEVHAINLKISLERVSYALGRLTEESVGIPLNQEDTQWDPSDEKRWSALADRSTKGVGSQS